MSISSDEKPEWCKLVERARKIIIKGDGTKEELAHFVGTSIHRVHEWLSWSREPKADKTLKILKWVEKKETSKSLVKGRNS